MNYHSDVLEAKIVLGERLIISIASEFIENSGEDAESLYASEPVMDICRGNGWDFIIRYKTGSIPSITEEYENIPEKETSGHAEFVNDIDYNGKPVNMLRFFEEKIVNGKNVRIEFQWLTSIRITKKNAEKAAETWLWTASDRRRYIQHRRKKSIFRLR